PGSRAADTAAGSRRAVAHTAADRTGAAGHRRAAGRRAAADRKEAAGRTGRQSRTDRSDRSLFPLANVTSHFSHEYGAERERPHSRVRPEASYSPVTQRREAGEITRKREPQWPVSRRPPA